MLWRAFIYTLHVLDECMWRQSVLHKKRNRALTLRQKNFYIIRTEELCQHALTTSRSTQKREVHSCACIHCWEDSSVYFYGVNCLVWNGEDRKTTEHHNRMAAILLLIRALFSAGPKPTILGYFRTTSKCLEARARISWYSDLRKDADKSL